MNDDGEKTARRRSFRFRLITGLAAVAVTAVAAVGLRAIGAFGPDKAEASTAPVKAAEKDKDAKEPPTVSVAAVAVGTISVYSTATANLVPEDEVKVVAEAEGKVVTLAVEEGDRVVRGAVLVQIDPTDASLAVRRAELAVRNAQTSLARADAMAAERLISTQDLDKARHDRDLAGQELAEARQRLAKTRVIAPFAGRITVRRVQPGQTVKPGDELFTLADFEPLVARVFLPEREVLGLRPGQEVRLALRSQEETRFVGRVRQVSPVVDTASGTVKVTVDAVNPPEQVRPGAFVTVELLRETRAQALLVPRAAVVRELQESFVYVAEGNTARKRAVTLGLQEGDRLEVVGGLKAGEQVVVSGQGGLKDQAAIVVVKS
jgi:membrane fusion protein (multidrug efflux system)